MNKLYRYNGAVEMNLLPSKHAGKKLVTFGDSRTWYDGQLYTYRTKTEWKGKTCRGYQQELVDLLGVEITNAGVSGEDSAQICARIREFDFTNYDIALLEGGVNDFIKSKTAGQIAPIGATFDTTTVYGAWQSAIEYILNNYPVVKIYMDVPAIAWTGANDTMFPYELAKVKKDVAELYNIPCKDLYKEGGINVLNRDYYYADDVAASDNWHLHFNDYGNALLGAELAQFINAN